jgi:predicted permease
MKIFPGLRRYFRLGAFESDPESDLDDELQFHLRLTEEELLAQGFAPSEAREEARRRFGDLDRYRKELTRIDRRRTTRSLRRARLEGVGQDLSYVFRGIRRSPGSAPAGAPTLALGIGANATMFGVVDHLLLSPPAHVVDADQVVRINLNRISPFTGEPATMAAMTWTDYQAYEGVGGFESVAAFGDDPLILGRGEEAVRVNGLYCTASFFPLLGVTPAIGRFFDEEEAQPGAAGVVVLSHGIWQRVFGGAPDVVGRPLPIGNGTYTVIGVTPKGFNGVELDPVDLYLPIHAYTTQQGSDRWVTHQGYYWLRAVGRIRSASSLEALAEEATSLHLNSRRDMIDQGRYSADARVVLGSVKAASAPNAPEEVRVSRWLAGVTFIVLLIACANVANLLLARGTRRRRELGIRVALGISRRRLVGQLLLESLVLAVVGGAVGLAMAYWGGRLLRSVFLPDVAWPSSPVNLRVLLFTFGVAGITGLLAGVAPALKGASRGVAGLLKDGGWGGTGRQSRSQSGLLVTQAALSVILLIGAGLFVRSLQHARSLDLGLEPEGVILVELDLEGSWDRKAVLGLAGRATDRLESLPGVAMASFSSGIPFWSMSAFEFFVPGMDSIPAPRGLGPFASGVSPDYFSTMGIQVREGRMFTEEEASAGDRVVVVTENMAQGLWGPSSALGQCVKLEDRDSPCWEVVGVAENSTLNSLTEEVPWQYYIPIGDPSLELGMGPGALFVKTRGDPAALIAPIRRELRGVDPGIRFAHVRPFQDLVDPGLRSWVLGATMFTLFGLLALVVAMVGLYSVLAFNVARRTRELGVRSAMGASGGCLLGMVLRQALSVTGTGIFLGLLLAFLASGSLEPLLFGTSATDPVVWIGVVGILLTVALVAGALPAWAASRVDPMEALRAD